MAQSLENRIAILERQVAQLAQRHRSMPAGDRAWLDDLYGQFAGDDVFDRAMKLGRKYRRSLRPGFGKAKPRR